LNNYLKTLSAVGLAAAMSVAAVSTVQAQDRVKWKMQSAFGGQLPHLGTSGVRFSKNISRLSGDKFEIKFYEPGALVPALECFDAASKGSVQSCWTTPGYHTGKLGTGVAFFTAVPFGPQIGEFLAWKRHGGGNAIRDAKYAEFGLVAVDNFCIGPETSGWFKKPVNNLDELKGMKMRFFGLGARVMQKMGVSTQLLAGADIYPALEKGVIDATEFSMPDIDQNLGFYQIAKNNYYPGWHQQVSCSELLMNRDAFNKLPDNYKAMIEIAAGESIMATYANTEAKNPAAMNNMLTKYGVTNRRWDDATLAKFEAAWKEVVKEESAKDPFFKEIAESFYAFREEYRGWGEAQSLKSTYLK
ncbi:MAG: TRAP transporter substrate-binding protein, partial [Gammaproteobacteria bacterium]|nr:TRAP transporter substrate-binding protein [Gammaproteobacteria bacterium]MDX2461089.1 TRAP transporter substrate-binding protein [Gammaproteobacteria bacterium]